MRIFLLVLVSLVCLNLGYGQDIKTGVWRGIISYDQAEIPFSFNVDVSEQGGYIISLENGAETIPIIDARWERDSLIIPMHSFDAEIIAKVMGEHMTGRWLKYYKQNADRPFKATLGKPRFDLPGNKKTVTVPKQVKMLMKPDQAMSYEALGIFEQKGQLVTGTVLTEVGDFRYFEGVASKDSFMLSSFDGVHGLLLKGHLTGKEWQGEFVMDNNYSEPWSGQEDADFTLSDPFVVVEQSDPEKTEPYFDILTAGSGFNTLNKDDFLGRVTIIQLMGSWCPNSLDETRYLTSWYQANSNRDIEVLAVFYEMNYSKAYGLKRINEYVKRNNIPYPTALGGPANKGQAALAFPFINKLAAFPTLMILDKLGRVRYMHTYFQGPATGDYYQQFDKRFKEIVDILLKE